MYILLFSANSRKAEYFSLKMEASGHSTAIVETLASVHQSLRYSDPDFVIVDSETFPEPDTDYRTMITRCKRKFHLFYDNELKSFLPDTQSSLSDEAQSCLRLIGEALRDIQIHDILVSRSFSDSSSEERHFLKQNKLPPSLATLLSCMLRNRDTDIPITTLESFLWKDTTANHQQTLYAYMNQLKTLLLKRNCPVIIQKRAKGSYRLSIKKAVPCEETAF